MYVSPTSGLLTLEEVFEKIKEFIVSKPECDYRVAIGCDSQQHKNLLVVVNAIIVHRVGKGAIYFYERTPLHKPYASIREKMYTETSNSIEVATKFKEQVLGDENIPVGIRIDLDIGTTGKTSAFIKELVGYVESCGFEVAIKDNSRMHDPKYVYPIAASSVADRHSK